MEEKIIETLFEAIDPAVEAAGFKVLDGDPTSVVIRHEASGTEYVLRAVEI